MRLSIALLLAALGSGCAPTLTTFQTAKPLRPKQFRVTAGAGVYAPLGPLTSLITQSLVQGKAAADAVNNGEEPALTDEEKEDFLTAGLGLATMTPGPVYEMSVRAGVVENLEVGLRYSVSAVRLDAKYRLLHGGDKEVADEGKGDGGKGDGGTVNAAGLEKGIRTAVGQGPSSAGAARSYDLAVGFGASKFFFKHPVFDALKIVELDNFSRYDFEVPVYLSAELGEGFQAYAAPKWVHSRTKLDEKLVNYSRQASNSTAYDVSLPYEVNSNFVGASFGVGVGYRYVHLLLEMTAGYTFSNPVVFGKRRDLGGVTLYPAAALAFTF